MHKGAVFVDYLQERHHVKFDDGEIDDINLSEEVWRLATADDETEASQAGGRVAMKEADLAIPGMPLQIREQQQQS